MEIDVRILCPDCGNESFEVQDRSNPPYSYAGSVCGRCGYVVTAAYIEAVISAAQAEAKAKIAAELQRSFGNGGFKVE